MWRTLALGKLLILSPQHSHLASEKVWNGRNDELKIACNSWLKDWQSVTQHLLGNQNK